MQNVKSVHGVWCSARVKKTACGNCNKPVLLFFCDCGSIVMIEEINQIAHVHSCKSGQNSFSSMDAFAVGRSIGRSISKHDLESGAVAPLALQIDYINLDRLNKTAAEQPAVVQASFIIDRIN